MCGCFLIVEFYSVIFFLSLRCCIACCSVQTFTSNKTLLLPTQWCLFHTNRNCDEIANAIFSLDTRNIIYSYIYIYIIVNVLLIVHRDNSKPIHVSSILAAARPQEDQLCIYSNVYVSYVMLTGCWQVPANSQST